MVRVVVNTVTGEMDKIINEIDYVHMKYLCYYFIGQNVLYDQVGVCYLLIAKYITTSDRRFTAICMGLLQLFEYRAFISVSVDFIIVSGTYYISVDFDNIGRN